MSYMPSHRNSNNERNERCANWRAAMRRGIENKNAKPEMSKEDALRKFNKLAAAFVAAGAVSHSQKHGCYKIRVGSGAKHYPVYVVKGVFRCACDNDERYDICPHALAAQMFAETEREAERQAKPAGANTSVEENLPFTAILNYGNRKGFDFTKTERFATSEEAARWLETEAFNKLLPTGAVTDLFGERIYELSEEDVWREV